MRKLLSLIFVTIMLCGLSACTPEPNIFSGGQMSVEVPETWAAGYNEAANELRLEDTGEEGTDATVKFQLIGENVTEETAPALFEGTIEKFSYEEIGNKTVGGLDLRGVSFVYNGDNYILYGGGAFDGKQLMVTILNSTENTDYDFVLDKFVLK